MSYINIYMYTYILLGSSGYLKFLPFGRVFMVKRHKFLHTWEIQVYIYNIYVCCDHYIV